MFNLFEEEAKLFRREIMENQKCAGTNSDSSNYSSPMPIIGLYVAGANSVCLLLIALDMCAGFRDRKRWLPCRLFPLNSVTLTLLGIATKLPVDLTTSMPSGQDQLSKLTGTVFICICMGFLMPSLGSITQSECASNMASLSIFVITVLVNICIQMHTGVIDSFQKEHIIILCCMMVLLSMLWFDVYVFDFDKKTSMEHIKNYFKNGQGSLLQRLKVCYLYSYGSDPQLRLCRKEICPVTCALCIICVAVLLQTIFRSLISREMEFCKDTSDYGWSMWAIVFSQTITILVGCVGTTIRFLSVVTGDMASLVDVFIEVVAFAIATLYYLAICLFVVGGLAIGLVLQFVIELMKCFYEAIRESNGGACFNICNPQNEDEDEDEEVIKKYKGLISDDQEQPLMDDWTLRKSGNCLKRLIEKSMAEVPNHLIQLLHQTPPSRESLTTLLKTRHERSSLSMVVLAGFATLSMPSSRSQCIFDSLHEVFEILFYIDQRMTSTFIKMKSWQANDVSTREKFYTLFQRPRSEVVASQMQLDEAFEGLKSVKHKLSWENSLIAQEVDMLLGFIQQQAYTSMEELHRGMEQLFVDMLSEHLVQLPSTIFKEIIESSPEDLEKRLLDALEVVSRIDKKLEGLLPWSFPVGTTIASLVTEAASMVGEDNSNAIAIDANTDEIPITENQSSMSFEGAGSIDNYTLGLTTGEEDLSPVISIAAQDEIIEIE